MPKKNDEEADWRGYDQGRRHGMEDQRRSYHDEFRGAARLLGWIGLGFFALLIASGGKTDTYGVLGLFAAMVLGCFTFWLVFDTAGRVWNRVRQRLSRFRQANDDSMRPK